MFTLVLSETLQGEECLLIYHFKLFLLLFICMGVTKAQWSPIKESGYAVTTNWHGVDVPIGQPVIATARTTNLDVTEIGFIWRDLFDNIVLEETLPVSKLTTPGVPPNVPEEIFEWAKQSPDPIYLYAQSTHIPNEIGEWGVQAIFYNAKKPRLNQRRSFVVRRATSMNVIPDASSWNS